MAKVINTKIDDGILIFTFTNNEDEVFSSFKEPITATTVFGNGQVFAYIVLDKIAEAIAPEIEKRKKKMQTAVNKYTEKYTK